MEISLNVGQSIQYEQVTPGTGSTDPSVVTINNAGIGNQATLTGVSTGSAWVFGVITPGGAYKVNVN